MGGTLKRYIITDKSFYWEAILIIVPVVLQAIVNQGVKLPHTSTSPMGLHW